MNTEKQIIAIAEAWGWKDVKLTDHETMKIDSRSITYWSGFTGLPPEYRHYLNRVRVPDYLGDLNPMHEAVSIFDYDQAARFEDHLCDICKRLNDEKENPAPWRFAVVNATASQRAEAFLRTIGKWEEEA